MLHRDAVVKRALDCDVSYTETIEAHQDGSAGAKRNIPREAMFEFYQEAYDPPLNSLFHELALSD